MEGLVFTVDLQRHLMYGRGAASCCTYIGLCSVCR